MENNENERGTGFNLQSWPTKIESFLAFIDILFGVLIAYIISEIPVSLFSDQKANNIVIFSVIYGTITAKMFLHWWALHYDLPIATRFFNRKMLLTYYFGAIIATGFYISIIKLILDWFSKQGGDQWILTSLFIIMAVFRSLDIIINWVTVPGLVKFKPQLDAINPIIERNLFDWYTKNLPKTVSLYSMQIIILLVGIIVIWTKPELILFFTLLYLFSEIYIEITFLKGRNKAYSTIEGKCKTESNNLESQGQKGNIETNDENTATAVISRLNNIVEIIKTSSIRAIYVFVIAIVLAYLEVQIEGANGWAAQLPTWRTTNPALTWIFGGRPVTGYHVALNLLLLLFFHWPIIYSKWDIIKETRVLSSYAILAVIWDFLWFAINPHFGLERYSSTNIWWFSNWFLGLPIDYYFGILTTLIIRNIPVFLKKETLKTALFDNLSFTFICLLLTAGFAICLYLL